MSSRIAFLIVTLFWLTMNYLLWRSEFKGPEHLGSAVPVEMVWKKILTAPDTSWLEIFHHGKKVGSCHWAANPEKGKDAGKKVRDDMMPEMMDGKPAGYGLELEGDVMLKDVRPSTLFSLGVKLDTNRSWQRFNTRLVLGHDALTVQSAAVESNILIRMEGEGAAFERRLTFADLQNPRALAGALDISLPLDLLGFPEMAVGSGKTSQLSPGLQWEARNDRVIIGHDSMRAYRLRTRLLDRYEIVILVSPVGEILRVELPGDWTLVYDQMGAM